MDQPSEVTRCCLLYAGACTENGGWPNIRSPAPLKNFFRSSSKGVLLSQAQCSWDYLPCFKAVDSGRGGEEKLAEGFMARSTMNKKRSAVQVLICSIMMFLGSE